MSQRDYIPGDVIQIACQPFYKTSNKIWGRGKICEECFKSIEIDKSLELKRCSGCQLIFYCSEKCQIKDWGNGHQLECISKTFRSNFQSNSYRTVELRCQLFRAMAFLVSKPTLAQKQFQIYNGQFRCFNDLVSHEEFVKHSRQFDSICEDLAAEILEENLNTRHIVADANFFFKLAGIFQINAFTICDESETIELGRGIYIEPSVFDHSCKPTAVFRCKGIGIEIRAIAPISIGEEPYIAYFSSNQRKGHRQTILKELYNFDCHCERCDSDMDKGVDFEKLQSLIDYISENSPVPNSQDLLMAAHDSVIQMMTKIYNEYDDRICYQYSRIVFALSQNNCSISYSLALKNVVDAARIHIQISYGIDHPEYSKFEQTICNLNLN